MDRAVHTALSPQPSEVPQPSEARPSGLTVEFDGARHPRLKKLRETVGLDLESTPFGIVERADRDHRQVKPVAAQLALPDARDLTIDQQTGMPAAPS